MGPPFFRLCKALSAQGPRRAAAGQEKSPTGCNPVGPLSVAAIAARAWRQAASLRSTYCRMPPFRKYSSSLTVSMRHLVRKVSVEPSLRVRITLTS